MTAGGSREVRGGSSDVGLPAGGVRLLTGGRINRARPLPFTFEGRALAAYEGDTLASALLANGVPAKEVIETVILGGVDEEMKRSITQNIIGYSI